MVIRDQNRNEEICRRTKVTEVIAQRVAKLNWQGAGQLPRRTERCRGLMLEWRPCFGERSVGRPPTSVPTPYQRQFYFILRFQVNNSSNGQRPLDESWQSDERYSLKVGPEFHPRQVNLLFLNRIWSGLVWRIASAVASYDPTEKDVDVDAGGD
ncbi:jg1132 [Pararge aegeria aegeria]|uniref:Jg1132 protein n=1 Tax=Pararge aegeria aegeria TaxID=348720 RepID=A0A8S4S7B2_9NEOP|nr:jg1132 [Pararge aegeria aegeria]